MNNSLKYYSRNLNINFYRLLGHEMECTLQPVKSDKINADIFEAILGSICLSHGFKSSVKDFVYENIDEYLKQFIAAEETENLDFSSKLMPEFFLVNKDKQVADLYDVRPDIKGILERLESKLKYKIKNPLIFIQALNPITSFLYRYLGYFSDTKSYFIAPEFIQKA